MGKTVPEVFRPRAVLKTEGRDRKIRAAKRTSQIAGFATVPSEKKKIQKHLEVIIYPVTTEASGDGHCGKISHIKHDVADISLT